MRILSTALLLCLSAVPLAGAQTPSKPGAAIEAAKAWLAVVDQGQYATSWDRMASTARSAVSKEQWIQLMKTNRAPLGNALSRKFDSVTYAKDPPGAPAGEYETLTFSTSFKNLRPAVETVSTVLESGGAWRVAGYWIKPAN